MALDDASGYNGTAAGDGGGGGGGGEEQSKEASPSLSATANGGSGGLGLRSSSKPNAGKRCIVLKSPMGGEPAVYDWPLKKGKGSVRKSEVRDSRGDKIAHGLSKLGIWLADSAHSLLQSAIVYILYLDSGLLCTIVFRV